jgi:hypothetical protein
VVAGGNQAASFGQFGVAIVTNCGQRFSFFHAAADALVEFQSDAVVNLVIDSSPQSGQRKDLTSSLSSAIRCPPQSAIATLDGGMQKREFE